MKTYFTIKEICHSDTAIKHNIANKPTKEIEDNIKVLINFLNPIRHAGGSALLVTSGYRCPELNALVGGSQTSAHLRGFGVDLIPANGKTNEFGEFLITYLKDNNIAGDQLLYESNGNTTWIHLGLYNKYMQQRCQIKHIYK